MNGSAKAVTLKAGLAAIHCGSDLTDVPELVRQRIFIHNRIRSDRVDTVAAQKVLPAFFRLKRSNTLSQRTCMRLQYAANSIAHANRLRTFHHRNHFNMVFEEYSKSRCFTKLAGEFTKKRRGCLKQRIMQTFAKARSNFMLERIAALFVLIDIPLFLESEEKAENRSFG